MTETYGSKVLVKDLGTMDTPTPVQDNIGETRCRSWVDTLPLFLPFILIKGVETTNNHLCMFRTKITSNVEDADE